jgi:alanine-glyoxylate transaminase / serine-glyoxylate transaminase / serine-pyruvate transaminase
MSAPTPSTPLSVHPPQRLLFGPGPTQVHPRVYEAMAQPIVGHLDPYFFQIFEEIRPMLQNVFGTASEWTLPLSSTGSGGMEAAVANFVFPGTKVLVFCAGYFADRICEMSRRHGGNVIRAEKPWGETFSDDEARDWVRRERPEVVAYVTAETSTGAFQQGKAICEAAHEVGAIVIADCVTSLGAMPVNVDDTGIDVAYSCSQKGLSCPPGLSPFTVSPRAQERAKNRQQTNPSWYFDLPGLVDYFLGSRKYHHTASATLFYALHQALTLVQEEGLKNRLARHKRAHEQMVRGLEQMGMPLLVAEGHRIWNLVTPQVPSGVDDAKVRTYLLKQYGIEIAGGFGPLAGKIFRIGVMGPFANDESVVMFLERLSEAVSRT